MPTYKNNLKYWPSDPPATLKLMQLVAEAASVFFKIPLSELRSRKRTNELVWPRSVCMWIARDANYSSNKVGKFWGRTHASVLHAVHLVNDLTETYPTYLKQFEEFRIYANEYLKKNS